MRYFFLLSSLFVCFIVNHNNVAANLVEITEENWEKLLGQDEWMVEL